MRIVWRYSFAFLGGFLAMSAHIYWLYGRGEWLSPQRLSLTIGNALIFAHLFGLMVIASRDLPIKHWLLRLVLSIALGTVLGTLPWFAHLYLYLFQANIDIPTLLFAGLALSIGFVVPTILPFRHRLVAFISMVIASIAIYIPIYLTHIAYAENPSVQALLYFQADNPTDVFLIGLPFALTLAIFPNLPLLFSSSPLEVT